MLDVCVNITLMSMMVTHFICCPFVHLERVWSIASMNEITHYPFFSTVHLQSEKKMIILVFSIAERLSFSFSRSQSISEFNQINTPYMINNEYHYINNEISFKMNIFRGS
jgi:hypothetical protein